MALNDKTISTDLNAEILEAYLKNIAETLHHIIIPELSGNAKSRATDCLYTTMHIAAKIRPDQSVVAAASEGQAAQLSYKQAMQKLDELKNNAAPEGRSCDAGKIEAYLKQHALGGPNLMVKSAKLLTGGRSKQTIIVELSGAIKLPNTIVIRQDWTDSVTGTAINGEFDILSKLQAAAVKVPTPLLLETCSKPLGAPFIVVNCINGVVDGDLLTAPATSGPIADLAAQLAIVHSLNPDDFLPLHGIYEKENNSADLQKEIEGFTQIISQCEESVPAPITAALTWLSDTANKLQSPRTLVHGDLGFHNFLCDNNKLSAILDWELAHVGTPAYDLGYIKTAVEGSMHWPEFMNLYRTAGGPDIAEFDIDWYSVYTIVWFYHMMVQARKGLTAGVIHDMDITFVCAHFGAAALADIARKMERLSL